MSPTRLAVDYAMPRNTQPQEDADETATDEMD